MIAALQPRAIIWFGHIPPQIDDQIPKFQFAKIGYKAEEKEIGTWAAQAEKAQPQEHNHHPAQSQI